MCENTKTESINFNKKFQLKHIGGPTTLSVKEFFFTLGVVNSFTLSVVGLCVDVSQLGRI